MRKRSKNAELEKETEVEDTACQCDPGPAEVEASTQVDPSQTRPYQIVVVRPAARVPPNCPICAGMSACKNNSAAISEDGEGITCGQCINVK